MLPREHAEYWGWTSFARFDSDLEEIVGWKVVLMDRKGSPVRTDSYHDDYISANKRVKVLNSTNV